MLRHGERVIGAYIPGVRKADFRPGRIGVFGTLRMNEFRFFGCAGRSLTLEAPALIQRNSRAESDACMRGGSRMNSRQRQQRDRQALKMTRNCFSNKSDSK